MNTCILRPTVCWASAIEVSTQIYDLFFGFQAIWFTDKPGVEGPVFGSSDKWNGLGVFFDSFDNDNKRNNPYVMAMVNDGTKVYDHEQ